MALTPEAWAKCDPRLRRALEALPPSSPTALPVMATLEPDPPSALPPGSDRAERVAWVRAREAEFERATRELVAALEVAGTRDVQRHWIARAVSARMPLAAIETAARRAEVVRLEQIVPHRALS